MIGEIERTDDLYDKHLRKLKDEQKDERKKKK